MARHQQEQQAIDPPRAPLTAKQTERLLGVAMRHEPSLRQAREVISEEDFADYQRGYAAVWAVALDHYDTHSELPLYDDICEEVERKLQETIEGLSDDELEILDSWLVELYNTPDSHYEDPRVHKVFRKYLSMFLEDQLVDKIRRDFSVQTTTLDVVGYLEQAKQKAQRILLAQEVAIDDPFPEGWTAQPVTVEQRTTTLPFLDAMLDGGDGIGEVNGLIAPFGGGKTTFAIRMVATRSKTLYTQWYANHKATPLGMSYLFFYEGDISQMRTRALSSVAKVSRKKLKDLRNLNPRGVFDDYERIVFRDLFDNDIQVPCERDRIRVAQKHLNSNLRLACMSGRDESNSGRGTGYIEEISNIIERDLEHQRRRLGVEVYAEVVVVDYIGTCVERARMANNWSDKEIQRRTEGFPFHIGQQVALPFNCPVWVLHQLTGEANAYAPGVIPDGTKAKGTKSLKENLDFHVVVGNRNQEDLCIWNIDKARRSDVNLPPEIVYLDGNLSDLHAVSSDYALDRSSRRIVPMAELRGLYADPGSVDEDAGDSELPVAAEVTANRMRAAIQSGRRRQREDT